MILESDRPSSIRVQESQSSCYPKNILHSPIALMVALPDRQLMSAAEYLAWELTQEERYEYWDGKVVA
ncbi:MAG: hypothetical protein ACMG55_10175, partial [Microcoleus sp.]